MKFYLVKAACGRFLKVYAGPKFRLGAKADATRYTDAEFAAQSARRFYISQDGVACIVVNENEDQRQLLLIQE